MSEQNKSLVRAFVSAVNAQDWTRVLGLLAPDFTPYSTAAGEPGVHSAADLLAFLQAEFVTFPDATETLLDIAIYRLENGRIAETWAEWDNLAVLRQLGHLMKDNAP